jgi:hypothetical protein
LGRHPMRDKAIIRMVEIDVHAPCLEADAGEGGRAIWVVPTKLDFVAIRGENLDSSILAVVSMR